MDDVWEWYCSDNEEVYHISAATRDEVLEAGRDYYDDATVLYLIEATKAVPTTDCFDFEWILDQFIDRNEECWGEDGEPISNIDFKDKRELELQFAALLEAYLKKHDALRTWAFDKTRNREVVDLATLTGDQHE